MAREYCSVRLPIRVRADAEEDFKRRLSDILAETRNMVVRIPLCRHQTWWIIMLEVRQYSSLRRIGTAGLCNFNWLVRRL